MSILPSLVPAASIIPEGSYRRHVTTHDLSGLYAILWPGERSAELRMRTPDSTPTANAPPSGEAQAQCAPSDASVLAQTTPESRSHIVMSPASHTLQTLSRSSVALALEFSPELPGSTSGGWGGGFLSLLAPKVAGVLRDQA